LQGKLRCDILGGDLMKILRTSFLCLVLLLSLSVASVAGFADLYLTMECDSRANKADIFPDSIPHSGQTSAGPEIQSLPDVNNKSGPLPDAGWNKNCTFSNGRAVRAKLGMGPVYPYGKDSGNQQKWLSLWVDGAKVATRQEFECDREGRCDLMITVTETGFTLCRKTGSGSALPGSPSGSERRVVDDCLFTHNDRLSKARDPIEYPISGEPVPPVPGSFVTLYAKEPAFCEGFQKRSEPAAAHGDTGWYLLPPQEALLFGQNEIFARKPTHREPRFTVDMNNDGRPDTVVALYSRTQYRAGDIYFIYRSGVSPPDQLPVKPREDAEQVFAKTASRIYPHYWADFTDAYEKLLAGGQDEGQYTVRHAGAPWWDPHDLPVFRFRYCYLLPFRYKGVTYFLAVSREAEKMHWYAVLKPQPDDTVIEECLFQRVRERY
jgi:hypothetical protein